MLAEQDRPPETNEGGGFLLPGVVMLVIDGVSGVASWAAERVSSLSPDDDDDGSGFDWIG